MTISLMLQLIGIIFGLIGGTFVFVKVLINFSRSQVINFNEYSTNLLILEKTLNVEIVKMTGKLELLNNKITYFEKDLKDVKSKLYCIIKKNKLE
jgi:CII-binding regulator of phage lambda lysogenization HflD